MTYARRVDSNQRIIKKAFEQMGCSTANFSRVGGGVPDLLIGIPGMNILVEVKSKNGKLTPEQAKFHAEWKGPKAVVRSVQEAAELVGKMGEWARRMP